jgi:hypothetical protein
MLESTSPCRVRLEVEAHEHPAVALEILGHWAAVRCPRALDVDDRVRLHLEWTGGAITTLPARVTSVAPLAEGDHLAQVEVVGVEGDWSRFLAYVGPLSIPA